MSDVENVEPVKADESVKADDPIAIDDVEAVETENSTEIRVDASEVVKRSMKLEARAIDESTRRVRIAVSSETPVQRSFGMEVLDHSPESIDLSFLNSGRAPLLLDHDPEKQIGVIESVELDGADRVLRSVVRFGKGALANEVFNDVADDIRGNISVGYNISKLERKDKDTYVARSWAPMEASIVSIPADVTVGVGRSADSSTKPVIKTDFKEETIMSEDKVNIAELEANARNSALKNAEQILALGSRHNQMDLAHKAVADGANVADFRGQLLDVVSSSKAIDSQEIGLTKNERKQFSVMRAIRALANPNDRALQEEAAFEFDCSRAAAKQYGASPQGIMLPVDVMNGWQRDLNSTDEHDLFGEDYRGSEFIDVLRNQSSVMQAGARVLNGLQGDVTIPKKVTAAQTGWISTEGGNTGQTEMTTGQINLTPKDIGGHTNVTRRLLQQSSMDVEAMVRDDLLQSLALSIDFAGLAGDGANGAPTGIKNTSGINSQAFAAANPTFGEVVGMETAVAVDNALLGNLGYIMHSSMVGALKTTEKATGTAQFVVEPGGTVNGYKAIRSNQGAVGDAYFGNYSDLIIGFFGGLDILVDPYTHSKSGTIRVNAMQSCDVAVRHAQSFCLGAQ
jgi:phage head maturation protease